MQLNHSLHRSHSPALCSRMPSVLRTAGGPLDSRRWVEDPAWHLTATLSLPDGPVVYGETVRLHLQLLNHFLNVFKDSFILSVWLLCLVARVLLDTRRRQQTLELDTHDCYCPRGCWIKPESSERTAREGAVSPAPLNIFLLRDPRNAELWRTLLQKYVTHQSIYPQLFSHISPLKKNSGWQFSKC